MKERRLLLASGQLLISVTVVGTFVAGCLQLRCRCCTPIQRNTAECLGAVLSRLKLADWDDPVHFELSDLCPQLSDPCLTLFQQLSDPGLLCDRSLAEVGCKDANRSVQAGILTEVQIRALPAPNWLTKEARLCCVQQHECVAFAHPS